MTAAILASSMAFIDGSALTVALPDLRAGLGADLGELQWILNAYVLALAALTLIGGALADVYGKARMLALGAVGFGAASALCAVAPGANELIAARVLQGTAAAVMTPASLALIGSVYPKRLRGRAIGAWAAASALTTAAGPVLGGWLVELVGWRAIFWINPPLAAAALFILARAGAQDRQEPRRFDLPGAALLALALGGLALWLSALAPSEAGGEGDASPAALASGLGGLAALAGYVFWERRSDHPMTPPALFGNRPFTGLNAATLAIYAALSAMFFLLPFELVDRRGLTATQAGLVFLPFSLSVGLLSQAFGAAADKTGPRPPLIFGGVGAAAAYAWMAGAAGETLIIAIIGPMALLGLSFAVLVAPLTAGVMASVTERDQGLASGVNNAASRIAQMLGVAAAAAFGASAGGYTAGLMLAAALSLFGAGVVAATAPRRTAPIA